jgi:hypothetical protein
MSLQGVLSDFGVADVFQLISQQRKTGTLEVSRGARTLEISFVEGAVVRARPAETRPDGALASFLLRAGVVSETELADAWREQVETLEPLAAVLMRRGATADVDLREIAQLATRETIFELFLWDDGRFQFRAEPVQESLGDERVGAESVLLDALRMRDEWTRVQLVLPDLSVVVQRVVDIEGFARCRAAAEGPSGLAAASLERLFHLCDGRLPARRVIDLSRLGTFQGGRGLVALVEAGALRVAERATEITASTALSADRARRDRMGYAVLGASALLAVVLMFAPAPQGDRNRSWPIPPAGLEEIRREIATDRVRAVLEIHRWAEGGYPESLDALRSRHERLLAAVPLDRYSYARLEHGYRLRYVLE